MRFPRRLAPLVLSTLVLSNNLEASIPTTNRETARFPKIEESSETRVSKLVGYCFNDVKETTQKDTAVVSINVLTERYTVCAFRNEDSRSQVQVWYSTSDTSSVVNTFIGDGLATDGVCKSGTIIYNNGNVIQLDLEQDLNQKLQPTFQRMFDAVVEAALNYYEQ